MLTEKGGKTVEKGRATTPGAMNGRNPTKNKESPKKTEMITSILLHGSICITLQPHVGCLGFVGSHLPSTHVLVCFVEGGLVVPHVVSLVIAGMERTTGIVGVWDRLPVKQVI